MMRKVAVVIIGCLLSIAILGFLMGWWGAELDDAGIALVAALLVAGTLLFGFINSSAQK